MNTLSFPFTGKLCSQQDNHLILAVHGRESVVACFCRSIACILSAFVFILPATAQCPVGFGQSTLFNEGWEFSTDSVHWQPVTLPHDWSIEGTPSQDFASCTGYLPGGMGWYRKQFDAPAKRTGKRFYLAFDGVYNRSTVWLNGTLLGYRPNGYVSFCYELPSLQKKGNMVMVRVDHTRSADSRWYTGSGIWRDVWMVEAPETHLAQWATTYRLTTLTADEAEVEVETAIEGNDASSEGYQITFAFSKDGQTVATATVPVAQMKASATLRIPHPACWDLDNPNLYAYTATLVKDGKSLDSATYRAGLRTLAFDADHGFSLNGQNVKVKGVCVHHDAGVLGAAVPREVWKRRLLALKDMGANAVRCSHNPQNPDLYDLCDELGLLVMDEASDEWEYPKRKWLKGWNKGEPGFEGSFDFFAEWIDRDVTDMVLRDRNHPSIFLWSIGNEVDYPNDPYSHPVLDGTSISQPMYGGYKPEAPRAERIGEIALRLSAIVRSLDASRPVTGALAGVVMSNETAYPDAVDVVGYNYTESRYVTDHEKYPSRVIYGSETGVGFPEWKAVRDNEHIFGQFVWTGLDYLGESGAWPSRGLGTGLIDFAGFAKPRGKFRQSLWSEKPMVYIGTYPERLPRRLGGKGTESRPYKPRLSAEAIDHWEYEEGAAIRVVCYTNTAQARLLLGGEEVGALTPYDDESGIISWVVPYAAGELVAEGCDADGQVLARYAIRTAGKAVALRTTVLDDSDNLTQILVEAVDADGNRATSCMELVTCSIEGKARFLGMENAVNFDMSAPKQPSKMLGRGCLVAYIGKTSKAPSTVLFTAEGLSSASLEVK